MPTSTEFKQPMTGETQALYSAVNEKLGKLWDGWLHVMDVLEKAQKLAARSGSPLVAKDAGRGRGADHQAGIVRGDRNPGAGDLGRCRPARARTPGGPHGARGRHGEPAQDRCGARGGQKAWPADGALRGRAGCRSPRDYSGGHGTGRRSLGTTTALEQLARVGRASRADRAGRVALWRCEEVKSSLRRSAARWPGIGQGFEADRRGGKPGPVFGPGRRGHRPRRLTALEAGDPDAAAAEVGRGPVDGPGGPGDDRKGPEGAGVLRARTAGPGPRNRAAARGLAAGRVVSNRPRARVCPLVMASRGAQPRPGPLAAGDIRPAGRAGRGRRDHDEAGICEGGRARRRAGPAAADRAPVDVGPG